MRRWVMLILGLVALAGQATGADVIGKVERVKDGDDLRVCDAGGCVDIRLCGVDAPERHAAARAARDALAALVTGKVVRCVRVGEGSPCDGRSKQINRGRVVAQCFVDGVDVGGALVKGGHACDWEKFSGGHYRALGGKAC